MRLDWSKRCDFIVEVDDGVERSHPPFGHLPPREGRILRLGYCAELIVGVSIRCKIDIRYLLLG